MCRKKTESPQVSQKNTKHLELSVKKTKHLKTTWTGYVLELRLYKAFYIAWSFEIGKFCKEEKMSAFQLFWASFLICTAGTFYFAWLFEVGNFCNHKIWISSQSSTSTSTI